ncbi:hypothetical protein [Vibrio splendidus]|uniref:Uncharacterized protein n=1 Tax=Vibrio splendidus TaxID=29497 RepID=A0A2N7JZF0_VIBSP|nr:hypothetical protein [Vibrio splendidus]PMM65994.1 hypothetical protein BCT54_16255 [Vibrio splendidus]
MFIKASRSVVVTVAAVLSMFWSMQVFAIQGPFSYVNVGGVPMYCTSANNKPVQLYIDPNVNQYIGMANTSNGVPYILLGPGFFNSVPPKVGQFWFLHECAHHVVGSNEAAADCFAIKNMRNLGLITHQSQAQTLLMQVSQMPGSNVHLPGPQRAQNIYNCLNNP